MVGIVSYGSYLPHWRIQRRAIAEALGSGGGGGSRSVASWDEDTTTMGVEAARWAVAGCDLPPEGTLLFATSAPAYLEKTNATAIHAALQLDGAWASFDMGGALRSVGAALSAGVDAARAGRLALVVLSDLRSGPSGSAEEARGGDGAAAFLLGPDEGLAEVIGSSSRSLELLDRWRTPGADVTAWDERFIEHIYAPLVQEAVRSALATAGVGPDQVSAAIVTSAHARLTGRLAGVLKLPQPTTPLQNVVGNAGVADPGLQLASVLDDAGPGETIVLAHVADGVDVLVLRTSALLPQQRARRPVAAQLAAGDDGLRYFDLASWRGNLRREAPRRAESAPPAATVSHRHEGWKFALAGNRCNQCLTMHLPPQKVCSSCGAVGDMTQESVAERVGTVVTFTTDHLASSPVGAQVSVVVNFDGGGRLPCVMTDVALGATAVGDRVRMSFRKLYTSQGVHDYFWKATPAPETADEPASTP
jgi:hydroxymethylglutaryl-CoA synthase